MLSMSELLEGMEEKYIPMLQTVNIADFTKCIATFSGIRLDDIKDRVIKNYLQTWAKNKYEIYKMLGNKTQFDQYASFRKRDDNHNEDFLALGKEYPAYYLWFEAFRNQTSNKISMNLVRGDYRWSISDFVDYELNGTTLTRFFKNKLNAPDELVTKIGRIFEYDKIDGTLTFSIDPVDIMTASENPYNWSSCYALGVNETENHADGCMGALLDHAQLISYVWKNEGKLTIGEDGDYELKNVRYKMMRAWVAFSPHFTTLHFNEIYPNKDICGEDFVATWRQAIESKIANYLGKEDLWVKTSELETRVYVERVNGYGYTEFRKDRMYNLKSEEPEDINVFDVQYFCPCGCGTEMPGAYPSNGDMYYNGYGFVHDNLEERIYCEYCDDYCENESCDRYSCEGCEYWNRNHPVCDLDCEECEDVPDDYYSGWGGDYVVSSNEDHCAGCARWQECHMKDEDEDED